MAYFSMYSLLLQRLTQFVKQPGILDRNDCLVCKGRHQLDLLLGKGVHFIAGQREHADRRSLAQKWNTEAGSISKRPLVVVRAVFGVCQCIRNMNWPSFQNDSPG